MNKDNNKIQIAGKKQKIQVIRINNKNYISLSALGERPNSKDSKILVYTWISKEDILTYSKLCEQFNNKKSQGHKFETLKK